MFLHQSGHAKMSYAPERCELTEDPEVWGHLESSK